MRHSRTPPKKRESSEFLEYNNQMREGQPAVYIMASGRNGTLYTGVTSDLPRRVWQHKNGETGGFVQKHGIKILVHYELFDYMPAAIEREKRIKKWRRQWKVRLIEKNNPHWLDLYGGIV